MPIQGSSGAGRLNNIGAAHCSTSSAPAGQPDWRRPDQYTYLQGMDRAGWAWEWLRRNSDYRRDAEQQRVDRRCTM